jgi:hypothetical protein
MFNLQACKFLNVTPPAAIVDNAAFPTATIDTKGFRAACIILQLGALDIAVAVLKLQESDDSGMSGATDVPGADFSVSPLTRPSATDDNTLYGIFVDLRGRKRYLDLSLTGGDGTLGSFASVIAILERAEETPNTVAERGLTQQAVV